jgi:hypothetical protein
MEAPWLLPSENVAGVMVLSGMAIQGFAVVLNIDGCSGVTNENLIHRNRKVAELRVS